MPIRPLMTSFALAASLVGCGGAATPATEHADPQRAACRIRFEPRTAPYPATPAATPAASTAPSRIVVNTELDLRQLAAALDAELDARVAEAQGISLGPAGALEYRVDRTPFRVSAEGDSLQVRSTLNAQAKACLRGNCYASCAPTAELQAEIPLRLTPDYRIARPKLDIEFTRGCRVRAMGGLVNVDITPTLRSQLDPALRQVQRELARQLPDLRPEAAQIWSELSKPRQVPLIGCVVLDPQRLVQGPSQVQGHTLRLPVAVLATPQVRPECPAATEPAPLPALIHDRGLRSQSEITLGVVTSLQQVVDALQEVTEMEVDGARLRIEQAKVAVDGAGFHTSLMLGGEICGELSLQAALAWNEAGDALQLTSPRMDEEDIRRITATSIDPQLLTTTLTRAPRVPMPLHSGLVEALVNSFSTSMPDETLDVRVELGSVAPAAVHVRDDEIVATMRLGGGIVVRQR